MSSEAINNRIRYAWVLAVLALLAACSGPTPVPETPGVEGITPAATTAPSVLPAASPTPFQPSPTPAPLAVRVNGEGITVQALQAELARFAAAAGREATVEDRQRVLNSLIEGALLAQAAREEGFVMDEALVQERIESLESQLGGSSALQAWMSANGYDEASFRADLAEASAAAWMRDRVLASVPAVAEQVHARQVLAGSAEEANEVVARLQAGEPFSRLAEEYDPVAGGDLSWFPRGYLIDPKLDEAAFPLQPGEWAGPVQTELGFHILEVIEREPERPLDPDALRALQARALAEWLEARRSSAQIEILEP